MARMEGGHDENLIPTSREVALYYGPAEQGGPIQALLEYRLRTGADITMFYHGLTLIDFARTVAREN